MTTITASLATPKGAVAPTTASRKAPTKMGPNGSALTNGSALAQQVDDLYELRGLIRRSQEAERLLTQQVTGVLTAAGLSTFAGTAAVAVLGHRTVLTPDPRSFLEAVGEKAFGALRVSMEAARELMLPADLEAISQGQTPSVLRVEARKAA